MGVVLIGGAGNATISWGELNAHLQSLYRARALYRSFRDIYHASDERPFRISTLTPVNPAFAERAKV